MNEWKLPMGPDSLFTRLNGLSLVLAGAVSLGPACAAERPAVGLTQGELASRTMDADRLLGPELVCPITRDGTPVGEHRVTFRREGDTLRVHARSTITVTLAFIPVYRLDYDSRSVWRNGLLDSLSAHTDDNGTETRVEVSRNAQGALVSTMGGTWSPRKGAVYPTNHWNPAVLGSGEVLNTISGEMNRVTLTDDGVETLDAGAGPILAHHFRYRGQLQADVWYDERYRWVKLAFDGSDGSRIEYLCDKSRGKETAAQGD